MDETLSQKKWGEKRFRALQTDRTTRLSAVNSTAPVQRGRKNAAANTRNGHDRLHIFFHPDYDRRLWHRTRSADPARISRLQVTLTTRALAGSLASAIALPAYRRWGISPRPEDALIAGISGR
jgi:hypothetical protein